MIAIFHLRYVNSSNVECTVYFMNTDAVQIDAKTLNLTLPLSTCRLAIPFVPAILQCFPDIAIFCSFNVMCMYCRVHRRHLVY